MDLPGDLNSELNKFNLSCWLAGAVTGDKSESTVHRIRRTYADKGIKVRLLHLQNADSHGTLSAVSVHPKTSSG